MYTLEALELSHINPVIINVVAEDMCVCPFVAKLSVDLRQFQVMFLGFLIPFVEVLILPFLV